MADNEEWNNFMHRVSDISGIINGLVSDDRETSENAQKLADQYLHDKSDVITDADIEIRLKSDRTIVNKRNEPERNPGEMDAETFMKIVERDADERAADRKARLERAETFKTRASRAFKRGDYELALTCYNGAIDQIKDSCLLYTNRALTLIKLKQYDKVFYDCERALRLNGSSLKAKIYEAAALKATGNKEAFQERYRALIESYPERIALVDDFLSNVDVCDSE